MLCWVQSHPLSSASFCFVCINMIFLLPRCSHSIRCYMFLFCICIHEIILKRFFVIEYPSKRSIRCLFSPITQSIPCWSINKPTTQIIIGWFLVLFYRPLFHLVLLFSPPPQRLNISQFFSLLSSFCSQLFARLPNENEIVEDWSTTSLLYIDRYVFFSVLLYITDRFVWCAYFIRNVLLGNQVHGMPYFNCILSVYIHILSVLVQSITAPRWLCVCSVFILPLRLSKTQTMKSTSIFIGILMEQCSPRAFHWAVADGWGCVFHFWRKTVWIYA